MVQGILTHRKTISCQGMEGRSDNLPNSSINGAYQDSANKNISQVLIVGWGKDESLRPKLFLKPVGLVRDLIIHPYFVSFLKP